MDDTNSLIEQRKAKLTALRVFLLAAACVFLAGCFDTKEQIILNPDGSGKVVLDSKLVRTDLLNEWVITTNDAGAFIQSVINDVSGVDAWKDISYEDTEDGTIHFRGTAYFPDLSKLKLKSLTAFGFTLSKDAAGNLTITKHPTSSETLHFPERKTVTDQNEILKDRTRFKTFKPLMEATLGSMKQETTIVFSGVLRRSSNFKTNSPNTLFLEYDGSRMVRAMERAFFDEGTSTNVQAATLAATNENIQNRLNKEVFGDGGSVIAVIKPGNKPSFDYAAEVAEARRSFPQRAKFLGIAPETISNVPSATDGSPAKIKVEGIEWDFGDSKSARASSGQFRLKLAAQLPGKVLGLSEVLVTRAVTIEGVDLLPEDESERPFFPRRDLSSDKTIARFDTVLRSPPFSSKGISEISGSLLCSSAENVRTVVLVSGNLQSGAKGPEFGAYISDVRRDSTENHWINFSTTLQREQIASVRVLGDGGQIVPLELAGSMDVGKNHSYRLYTQKSIPPSGKLVAEVLTGSKTVRIPYSLTNITLFGQPVTK